MKKLLIIPVTVLVAGSFFLASCGSNNADATMKAPVQNKADTATQKATKESGEKEEKENEAEENEKEEKSSIVKPASYVTSTDANAKTTENLQAAFKGETTASAKYAAYSKKAEQEGYHQIALLFKAASAAENIHANNHKAVLQESGVSAPAIKPEFTVKTTKENLQDAIAGETYEVTTMYPEFLTAANAAGNQLAMISLNYAYKTEKKHKIFYEAALNALQKNTVKSLPTVFYVCPTCGNTYETTAPARCGISMTSGNKFIKIISL
jgi:rubrerythrin